MALGLNFASQCIDRLWVNIFREAILLYSSIASHYSHQLHNRITLRCAVRLIENIGCVLDKPYAYSFSPASRRLTEAFGAYISFSFRFHANPGLTSYTNWSFVNAYGSVTEYPVGSDHLIDYVNSSPAYVNFNSYGNYSITLTNSNGSTTTTFQVLPPGKSNRIQII